MVFPKLASSQINYLKNALPTKGTTSANTYLVSGATSGGTSIFYLVVDDFGIKVTNMHDMDHFVEPVKEHYTVAFNLTGSLLCSIQLTWNYAQGHVDCHMPSYINKALTKYQHPKPVTPQHAPYKAAPIQYGTRVQRVEVDTTQPLTPKEIKHVQDILGTLLYHAQVVDPTLLAAISAIAAEQANSTWAVADACHQLLDYVATHPNAGI
jgi:hypothetical protein